MQCIKLISKNVLQTFCLLAGAGSSTIVSVVIGSCIGAHKNHECKIKLKRKKNLCS